MRCEALIGLSALFLATTAVAAQERPRAWEPVVPSGMEGSYERNHYAPAVRIGNLLIVSGVIGYQRGADNGPEAQFDRAFRRLGAVMEGAGLSLEDVAEITTYHVNLGELGRQFITVKDRYFPRAPYPAWTAVGVERLFLEGVLVEIRATAAISPGRSRE